MRQLRRPVVALPTLTHDGLGVREHQRQLSDASRRGEFPSHWLAGDVRGALRAMQGWVCAYCLKALSDGDEVEHFRPKSLYWWLAYDFNNYFLACHRCNRASVKGTRFPLVEGASRTTWETRATIDDEPRLLAEPCTDPVDAWFTVDLFDNTFPVVLRGGVERQGRAALITRTSIEVLQLNIDVDLVQARDRAWVKASKLYREREINVLRRRASRYSPQGMTWRAFIETMVDDVSLPTADEELQWFLDDVFERLCRHGALARRDRTSAAQERECEELGWLLAVIARDPPALDAKTVSEWLKQQKLDEWVSEYAQLLG